MRLGYDYDRYYLANYLVSLARVLLVLLLSAVAYFVTSGYVFCHFLILNIFD